MGGEYISKFLTGVDWRVAGLFYGAWHLRELKWCVKGVMVGLFNGWALDAHSWWFLCKLLLLMNLLLNLINEVSTRM